MVMSEETRAIDSFKVSLVATILLSMNFDLIEGHEIFPNGQCQFMTPCDISHVLSPIIDLIETRIDALGKFYSELKYNVAELTERMDVLEDQTGVPYYIRRGEQTSSTELDETEPYLYESQATRYLRRIGMLSTETPLLRRIAAVEKWKQSMEENVVPAVNSNIDEVLRQLINVAILPQRIEDERNGRMVVEKKVEELQREAREMRLDHETKLTRLKEEIEKEHAETFTLEVANHKLRVSVDDMLSNVTLLNDSLSSKIEELEEVMIGSTQAVTELKGDWTKLDENQKKLELSLKTQSLEMNKLIACNQSLVDHVTQFEDFTNATSSQLKSLKKTETDTVHAVLRVMRHVMPNVTSPLERRLSSLERQNEKVKGEVTMESEKLQLLHHRFDVMEIRLDKNASILISFQEELKNMSVQLARLEKWGKIWDSWREEMKKSLFILRKEYSQQQQQVQDEPFRSEKGQEQIVLSPQNLLSWDSRLRSCHLRLGDNVVASSNGRPLKSVIIAEGHEVKFRCRDIGSFKLHGSTRSKCHDGKWTEEEPWCEPLSSGQEMAGSVTNATPSIRIVSSNLGVSPVGEAIVPQGSKVILSCLFPKTRDMTLQWKMTSNEITRFLSGQRITTRDSSESERNQVFKYESQISSAERRHAGIYTCQASNGKEHSIRLKVENINCPPPLFREMVQPLGKFNTSMNSVIYFRCSNPNFYLHWPDGSGDPFMKCLPSGIWSRDFPTCESSLKKVH